MATRTVRLSDEAEAALREVMRATRLPISEVLTRGLYALRAEVRAIAPVVPFEVYRTLDLGPGGYAIAPSTDVKRAVHDRLRRKHGR